jgi:hypothetical protein
VHLPVAAIPGVKSIGHSGSCRRGTATASTAAPIELGAETVTARLAISDTACRQTDAAIAPASKTTLALDVEGIT